MNKIIILILHLLLLSSCKIEVSNSVSVNSNTSIISSLSTSRENSSLSTSSSPVINENCECKECFYCLLKFTIDDIISIKMSEAVYYSSSIKIKEEFYEEVLGMVNVKYSRIEYDEQYMYFFAIALFFLLVEFLISTTRNNRRLFGSSLKYLIVPVLLLSSVSGFAQDDKSEVRSGNRAFKKGNYDKALVEFQRGLLKDSTSVNGNFNTANTLYRMENFTDAHTFMDAVAVDSLKLHSPRRAADYFYNKGNLSLKQKNYHLKNLLLIIIFLQI